MKRVITFVLTASFLLAGLSGLAFAKPFHFGKSSKVSDEKGKDVKKSKENKTGKKQAHKGKSKKTDQRN